MNIIKIELGTDLEYVNIYPLADLHIGSRYFKRKRLEQDLQVILDDPNGYLILNGDLVNNTVKDSVGDIVQSI